MPAIARLQAEGYEVVALTPSPSADDVRTLAPPGERWALLVGAEGPGLSAAALAAADRRVRITMAPGVDSLNVATAAAIALHHLAGRQRPRAEVSRPTVRPGWSATALTASSTPGMNESRS